MDTKSWLMTDPDLALYPYSKLFKEPNLYRRARLEELEDEVDWRQQDCSKFQF